MTTYASSKLVAYAALIAVGLLTALIVGRPEPAALVAPFVLAGVVGLTLGHAARFDLSVELDRTRAVEDDVVTLSLEIRAHGQIAWLQAYAPLPAGLEHDATQLTMLGVRAAADQPTRLRIPIRCRRWGVFRLGELWLRCHDSAGFFVTEAHVDSDLSLRVYPRAEALRSLIRPRDTQIFSGNQLSRRTGDGIEFAEARPFAPGDLVRHVNWRLTTRLGALYVNEQHLERNADIILFLDAFTDIERDGRGTIELAVRATATLAQQYLRVRDRVGLLSFGGSLRWLTPNMGVRQLYRIVDALLDTEAFLSYAWKGIDLIPPRTLPPNALVLALSPMLDSRTVQALFDLKGRGFDLSIVEVSPFPFVAPGQDELRRLADRLWRLQREVLRVKFRRLGVPVAVWTDGEPLAPALEEVSSFRRSARTLHA